MSDAAPDDPGPLEHTPVLVVHGAAVRNRATFEHEVARLAAAVGGEHPFIPVFWGDLGRPAESIEEVLPYLEWARSPERSGGGVGVEPRAGDPAGRTGETDHIDDGDEQAGETEEDLDGLGLEGVVLGEEPEAAIADVTRRRARLARVVPARELERLAERIGSNWRRQSETARRRLIGALYRAVRDQYLAAAAHFAGDVILYQRRQPEIQARVWETVMREAPGYGLPERPVHVLTHSLGGSVAFDLAVGGHPPLHVDQLLTCACTAPYFHVIGCSPASLPPHVAGQPVTLPPTVRAWTNFFIPLDPWGYVAAPAFRLHDGSAPEDLEVHAGDRGDRILRHGATHYWNHPLVVARLRAALGVAPEAEPGGTGQAQPPA